MENLGYQAPSPCFITISTGISDLDLYLYLADHEPRRADSGYQGYRLSHGQSVYAENSSQHQQRQFAVLQTLRLRSPSPVKSGYRNVAFLRSGSTPRRRIPAAQGVRTPRVRTDLGPPIRPLLQVFKRWWTAGVLRYTPRPYG